MSHETAARQQLMENHLVACIQEYLQLNLTKNSVFLAERLVAQFPNENNLHLLATCYHRSGQTFRAYHLLRGLTGDACRYLFAICCVELGKYTEAEAVLLPNHGTQQIPNGPAGMYLLGKVYQLTNRQVSATRLYRDALQLDPLLWCAFEELCSLGQEADTLEFLNMDPGTETLSSYKDLTPHTTPMVSGLPYDEAIEAPGYGVSSNTPTLGNIETPENNVFETPNILPNAIQPPPMKKVGRDETGIPAVSPMLLSDTQFLSGRKFVDEGTVRKISNKLFSDPATALKIAKAVRDSGKQPDRDNETQDTGSIHAGKTNQGRNACISLLQMLGQGYRLLCLYKCPEAIQAFSQLPVPQYSTGWVLQCVGQAYFEMVDYHSSEKIFQQLRLLDPCRLEGLEVYSTVLWHMKKEVELSNLAQEAVALDRHSPVAWCIMGNCFSLQKEHETALRFFQRSLQLDPTFPYAFTLCGHEYFANEDFDKGLTCYRHAIRLNPRHYNAWFGSGHIYFRQEKYGMAEYHFRRAHQVNRSSSVLKCYLGMALHKVKRTGEALQTLKQAVELDPKNPLARYEYASVLASIGNLEESVSELTYLHNIVPKEASVLFQKGKVLKRLGLLEEALKCFSDALDLQPPSIDTNLIKSAIDRISVEDDGDDDI